MARSIAVFFLLALSHLISAQDATELVLTKEQNEKWFDQLELLDFNSQLTEIKNRLLSDTNVYVKQYYPHGLNPNEAKIENRVRGCCKPILVFDGEPFGYASRMEVNETKTIIGFLENDKIKEIKIFRGTTSAALYGSNGQAGAILFTFMDKESLAVMRRIIDQLK